VTSYHYPLGAEKRIRVLVADRHTIVRQGIKSLLEREPGLEVIADTGDGKSLIELAHEQLPDVIVTEISLPRLDGLEATRPVVSEGLPCQVLFLTGNSDRESVVTAFNSGARGYLLKDAESSCITYQPDRDHAHLQVVPIRKQSDCRARKPVHIAGGLSCVQTPFHPLFPPS